jgi:hypothetical protein
MCLEINHIYILIRNIWIFEKGGALDDLSVPPYCLNPTSEW